MKQRPGMGCSSALARPLSTVLQPEDRMATLLREEGFGCWRFPISHLSWAWWVFFALGTVASFWIDFFFPFLLAQVVFCCSKRSHSRLFSIVDWSYLARQRMLTWPQASSATSWGAVWQECSHVGRQLPCWKTLEATWAFHCRACRHLRPVGPIYSPCPRAPFQALGLLS